MYQGIVSKKDITHVARGCALSLATALIMIAAIALCISNEYIDITSSRFFVPVIWMICSVFGAFGTGERGADNKIYLQVLTCVLLFLVALATGILGFDGNAGTRIIANLLACTLGGIGGIQLKIRKNKRMRTRTRRHLSR